jgi:hypothetical protein
MRLFNSPFIPCFLVPPCVEQVLSSENREAEEKDEWGKGPPLSLTQQVIEIIENAADSSDEPDTVVNLVEYYSNCWDGLDFTLEEPFNLDLFIEVLTNHLENDPLPIRDPNIFFGHVKKIDFSTRRSIRVFVRGDIHDDLKSLIENLKSLKKEGLLNDELQCEPGTYLFFIGDYCDRGKYGTEVLELLLLLYKENPGRVFLIQGNHENTAMNAAYDGDEKLRAVLNNAHAKSLLDKVYQSLPLGVLISKLNKGSKEGEALPPREYILFTHGGIEPSVDFSKLLDRPYDSSVLWIKKNKGLSTRVKNFTKLPPESLQHQIATRVKEIFEASLPYLSQDITLFNWSDISLPGNPSSFGFPGERKYSLSLEDLWHCMQLCSDQGHTIPMIIRGHQHVYRNEQLNNKITVVTLPAGPDCPAFQNLGEPDRAMIIHLKPTLAASEKQYMLRMPLMAETELVTARISLLAPD